jgi:Concanavalin A-like lectin/glucanases superfamily
MMSPTFRWLLGLGAALALALGAISIHRYVARTQSAVHADAGSPRPRPQLHARVHVERLPSSELPESQFGAAEARAHRERGQTRKNRIMAATPSKGASGGRNPPKAPTLGVAGIEPSPIATRAGGAALSLSFDGSPAPSDSPAPLIQQNVEIDPREGAALFPPAAVLAYPDAGGIDPGEGTIAMWVRLEWDPTDLKTRALVELLPDSWQNRLEITLSSNFVRFLISTSDGQETAVGTGISWPQGQWHHLATTWGQALLSLYVDGRLADEATYSGSLTILPQTPLYIASSPKGPRPDTGAISLRGFAILQNSAPPDELASLMASTAPSQ